MNAHEYEYLSCIRDNKPLANDETLNFRLEDMGYVTLFIAGTVNKLTEKGYDALSEYERHQDEMAEQAARDAAENERRTREKIDDRKHEWLKLFVGAVLGSALTLIVQIILRSL